MAARSDEEATGRAKDRDVRRRLRPRADLEDEAADGGEHRRFPRARIEVRMELTVGPASQPTFRAALPTRNLSVSGAFIASTFFLRAGTELQARFTLPSGEDVEARSEVVRLIGEGGGEGPGMGLRFLSFERQSEVGLARLFVGERLEAFVAGYLRTARMKGVEGEQSRIVDALAAWELLQVTDPEDPWRPQGVPPPDPLEQLRARRAGSPS